MKKVIILLSLILILLGGYFHWQKKDPLLITPSTERIILSKPLSEEYVSDPFIVAGFAHPDWFINNEFPVTLTNWDGLIISEALAIYTHGKHEGGLMPFSATVTFEKPVYNDDGFLILARTNPTRNSSISEHHEIRIHFK
jgi:hypothetical protein